MAIEQDLPKKKPLAIFAHAPGNGGYQLRIGLFENDSDADHVEHGNPRSWHRSKTKLKIRFGVANNSFDRKKLGFDD